MPIYDPVNNSWVKTTWERVIQNAKDYPWAEQTTDEHFDGTFRHWPRSLYKSFGSNSNTFVREIVRRSNLTMVEMDGSHPGSDLPYQNQEEAYSTGGGPNGDQPKYYNFYENHTPWKGSDNSKAKPPGYPG